MKKPIIAVLAVLLLASLACSLASSPVVSEDPAAAEPVVVDKTIRTDDFSDTDSGWPDATTDGGFAYYENGAYHIEVTTDQMDIWAHPGWNMPNDVSVKVDVTLSSGTLDNDYGLICRYNSGDENEEYYFFIISSDGYAGIGLSSGGETNLLSGENMEAVGEIKQGLATNSIQADCVGNQLTLYVNDTQVMSASDSTLTSGDVGLIAGTFDEPNINVLFDNLVVSNP